MDSMTQSVAQTGSTTAAVDAIFTALLSQLPTGIVIAARDGRLELINDVARTVFDEHQRLRGLREPWVGPASAATDGLEPIHWIIARVLLTGEIVRNEEVEYLGPRDEWRTLSVSATPIPSGQGEIGHALVTFVDVTAANRFREWEPLIRSISRL
jgi:PAS domain-containing protein